MKISESGDGKYPHPSIGSAFGDRRIGAGNPISISQGVQGDNSQRRAFPPHDITLSLRTASSGIPGENPANFPKDPSRKGEKTDVPKGPQAPHEVPVVSFEATNQKEFALLTPDHLIDLFGTNKFQHALAVAASETQSSGYETSFIADVLEANGAYHIDTVTKGGTDSMRNAQDIEEVDGITIERHATLFNFHFHLETSGPIVPSDTDLSIQAGESARENGIYVDYPYLGVGHVSEKNDVSLLIIQSPPNNVTRDELDEYNRALHTVKSQADIHTLLDEMGFKNCVVAFKKRGDRYAITQASKAAIRDTLTPLKTKIFDPQAEAEKYQE